MKKTIVALLLLGIILFSNSCTTEPPQPSAPAPNYAAPDLEATAMMYDALSAPASLGAFAGEGVALGVAVVFGAYISHEEAGVYVVHPYTYQLNLQSVYIPDSLALSPDINPFEFAGTMHNEALNLIVERGGEAAINKLLNKDPETWDAFLKLDPGFQEDHKRAEAVNSIIQYTITSEEQKKLDAIKAAKSPDEIIALTGLSPVNKDFILDAFNTYLSMRKNNTSVEEVANFANSKIKYIHHDTKAPLDKEQKTMMLMLTILKHSDYYWYGK